MGIWNVDVSHFRSGGTESLPEVGFLDIHVEEVGEEDGVIQLVLIEVGCCGGELIELVGFVTIERFVDEGHSVLCSALIGSLQGFSEPDQRLIP